MEHIGGTIQDIGGICLVLKLATKSKVGGKKALQVDK